MTAHNVARLAGVSQSAEAGASVTLVARSGDEIGDAAAAIRSEGGQADALCLDVGQPTVVAAALGAREPYDILVNNASINRPATFTEVTVEDFDAVAALNLHVAFFVAQAVAKGLIATQRPGSIINVSSQMGHVGGARRTVTVPPSMGWKV